MDAESIGAIIRERLRAASDLVRKAGYHEYDADVGHLLAEVARLRDLTEKLDARLDQREARLWLFEQTLKHYADEANWSDGNGSGCHDCYDAPGNGYDAARAALADTRTAIA